MRSFIHHLIVSLENSPVTSSFVSSDFIIHASKGRSLVQISIKKLLHLSGYPLHRDNRENGNNKNPCQGNFAKTQGIWFSQVVNSLILNVKDISIFATRISNFVSNLDKSAKSFLCM